MKEVRVTVQESEKRSATLKGQNKDRTSVLPTASDWIWVKYLGDPPNVLSPVFLAESQVLVQSEPYIVSVKSIGGQAQVQEVLL